MSDSDMRAFALDKAVEVCGAAGRTEYRLVMEAARAFYHFLRGMEALEKSKSMDEMLRGCDG